MNARRGWSLAGLSGTAALLAAAGGVTWYYTSRLTEAPADVAEPGPQTTDLARIRTVSGERVTLQGPTADRPGHWGLDTATGYALLLPDVTRDGDAVVRTFQMRSGLLRAGDQGIFDAYAYPAIGTTLTPSAEEITIPTPLGEAPAWFVPGSAERWLIGVHGRAGRRHEGFRMAAAAAAEGLPALLISYRNDGEAPRSPDGRSHLGATEWQDVEAAIDYALSHGARSVILAGFSMGGACVAACVRLSERAEVVDKLVLEAPVLDWGPVVRRAAIERGLPPAVLPALLPAAMALARARVGIDWSQLRPDPAVLSHPILLIHGDTDRTVPVELSDVLADARPDIITYLRVAGAGHLHAWNHAREAYETAVRAFVASA